MSVAFRIRQIWAIARLHLRRVFFSRRSFWVYLLAMFPTVIFLAHGIQMKIQHRWIPSRVTPAAILESIPDGAREHEVIEKAGKHITVPTLPEMLRTKAWMVISRNTTRDYIDCAALAKHIGIADAARLLKDFDSYYLDLIRGDQASPVIQLIRQLAEPAPCDLDEVDTSQYKGIQSPFDSWNTNTEICRELSVTLGEMLD